MANRYDNAEGYYYVYFSLTKPRSGETLEQMDKKTKYFALYHLLKSYEMHFESAKYQVEEVFGEGFPVPKSSYYLQEFAKSN